MSEAIIYAICGVLIMAIGFALGIWVERSYQKSKENDDDSMHE